VWVSRKKQACWLGKSRHSVCLGVCGVGWGDLPAAQVSDLQDCFGGGRRGTWVAAVGLGRVGVASLDL